MVVERVEGERRRRSKVLPTLPAGEGRSRSLPKPGRGGEEGRRDGERERRGGGEVERRGGERRERVRPSQSLATLPKAEVVEVPVIVDSVTKVGTQVGENTEHL